MIEAGDLLIRWAKREEASEINGLLKRLGLNVPGPDEPAKVNRHWERLWDGNPFFRQFAMEVRYGWVMEHRGRIVGFFGSIPRAYRLGGELVPVAIASQWGVEKAYRKHTHLLCTKFFQENPISLKLVTTAIKPTGRIFERHGGQAVPDPRMGEVYLKPLRLPALLAHGSGRYSVRRALARLSALLPWGLRYKYMSPVEGLKAVSPEALPQELEVFLRSCLGHINGLVAHRDLETLRWYYAQGNREAAKELFVYRQDGLVRGFAALVDEPVPSDAALRRFKLIDLLAESRKVRKRMIQGLLYHVYKAGGDVLEIHQPGLVAWADLPALWLKRRYPNFPLFYQTPDTAAAELLKDKQCWHIMPYDGDTCLL